MPLQVAIAEERKRSINKYESRLTRLDGIRSHDIFCGIYLNDRFEKTYLSYFPASHQVEVIYDLDILMSDIDSKNFFLISKLHILFVGSDTFFSWSELLANDDALEMHI